MVSNEAILGLIGAIIAAIITGGGTWLTLKSGNRKTNAAADESIARAAQATVALVSGQMAYLATQLTTVQGELKQEVTRRKLIEEHLVSETACRKSLEEHLGKETVRCNQLAARVEELSRSITKHHPDETGQ